MGTCRQCGSWSVTGHNHRKVIGTVIWFFVIHDFCCCIRYISPICQKPPWTDLHQIWRCYGCHRHNHLYQIFWWSVKECGFCGGVRICHLPLTTPVAINTGLVLQCSSWCVENCVCRQFRCCDVSRSPRCVECRCMCTSCLRLRTSQTSRWSCHRHWPRTILLTAFISPLLHLIACLLVYLRV